MSERLASFIGTLKEAARIAERARSGVEAAQIVIDRTQVGMTKAAGRPEEETMWMPTKQGTTLDERLDGGDRREEEGGAHAAASQEKGRADQAAADAAAARMANRDPGARPTLREGDRGPFVALLQRLLGARGHRLATDGDFGQHTATAVQAFQRGARLAPDGVVGPKSWSELDGAPAADQEKVPEKEKAPEKERAPEKPKDGGGELGSLSAHYESNGKPGIVSTGHGDAGGVSYGAYQMMSAGKGGGTVGRFARESKFASELAGLKPGSAEFTRKWKEIAARDPDGFLADQHEFIKKTHFDAQSDRLKKDLGLDVGRLPRAVQQVIWSTAVQHGGGTTVVEAALKGRDPAGLTGSEVIALIYAERGRVDAHGNLVHFGGCSAEVQRGVKQRFRVEQAEALAMLGSESSSGEETALA